MPGVWALPGRRQLLTVGKWLPGLVWALPCSPSSSNGILANNNQN